jgi:hypothetical protein
VHCIMSGYPSGTYCCPTSKPSYQNNQCIVLPRGNWYCNGGTGAPPPIPTACTNGGTYNGKCIIYHCPNGCGGGTCGESSPGVWWDYAPCSTAALTGNECGQIDTVTDAGRYCSPQTGCDVKALRCSGCSGGPTPPPQPTTTRTPTPTLPSAPQCIGLKIYKGNVPIYTSADFATLRPGDILTAVLTPSGSATKARFRVNTGTWNETTSKNSSGQYTWNWTIPTVINTTTYTIEGEFFNGTSWY